MLRRTFVLSVFHITYDLVEETLGRRKFRMGILLVCTQY